MSIPKEPRQQMINIMYLVLTAMLALNVSAEILNAFRILKRSIDGSTMSTSQKLVGTMSAFETQVKKENRGADNLAAAKQAQLVSIEFQKYIDGLDTTLLAAVGVDAATGDLKVPADQDTPTRLFVDKGGQELGKQLAGKIEEYRNKFASFFKKPEDKLAILGSMPLKIDTTGASTKQGRPWEDYTFHQMPAQAVRTLLAKFKNDGIATESEVINKLYSDVTAVNFIYDNFKAAVVPNSTYLLQGEILEA